MLDPELIEAWVASHPGREPRGLPAPRPDSCDACQRPLERHEVAIFELRGTPVVGLCAAACWEAALDRLSSSEDRHAHPDCERNQMIVLTTASPGVRPTSIDVTTAAGVAALTVLRPSASCSPPTTPAG